MSRLDTAIVITVAVVCMVCIGLHIARKHTSKQASTTQLIKQGADTYKCVLIDKGDQHDE